MQNTEAKRANIAYDDDGARLEITLNSGRNYQFEPYSKKKAERLLETMFVPDTDAAAKRTSRRPRRGRDSSSPRTVLPLVDTTALHGQWERTLGLGGLIRHMWVIGHLGSSGKKPRKRLCRHSEL